MSVGHAAFEDAGSQPAQHIAAGGWAPTRANNLPMQPVINTYY
jgi:hypothetical protein